ncbi:MAG TPA: oligosaccharide flippase family protein [Ignavibacteria bacterium]|nr:oligosaccharide flippase family protein [Ignavibacteria bacterium]
MLSVHLKSLFSQSVFYGLGLILNRSIGILLLPLYTAYFTSNQLGTYAIIYSLWLFINVIYLLGLETSFLKFFIDAKTKEEKSEIYCNTLTTISCTSIAFSVLIFFSAEFISGLINFENFYEGVFLIKLLSVVLFCDALYRFPLLLLRANQKPKVYFRINIITISLNLFFNIFFISYLELGIASILYSYIISSFITFIISLFVTSEYLLPSFSTNVIKKLLSFGNKFIYIGLLLILIDQSDKFFLKYYLGESATGIYSAISRLAAAMGILMATFKFTWTPYFLNLEKSEENKTAISKIFNYFVFTGMLLCLIFSYFIPELVKINIFGFSFIDADYWLGLSFLPVIVLASLFSGIFAFLNVAPFFSDKTYLILIITFIGFIINLICNYFLIPMFEISGAAYSLLITYFILSVLILFISQRIYPIKFNFIKILILLLTGIVLLYLNSSNILLNIVFIVVYLLISSYFAGIRLSQAKSILKRST